jgi:hypothetical protein
MRSIGAGTRRLLASTCPEQLYGGMFRVRVLVADDRPTHGQ